jgi:hypothetical protein
VEGQSAAKPCDRWVSLQERLIRAVRPAFKVDEYPSICYNRKSFSLFEDMDPKWHKYLVPVVHVQIYGAILMPSSFDDVWDDGGGSSSTTKRGPVSTCTLSNPYTIVRAQDIVWT